MWIIQPKQLADAEGQPTGRWRMTATSDEDGGGPFGDASHDHASAEEAEGCDQCDEFVHGVAGFPSRKRRREMEDERERREYERLKEKFADTKGKVAPLSAPRRQDTEGDGPKF